MKRISKYFFCSLIIISLNTMGKSMERIPEKGVVNSGSPPWQVFSSSTSDKDYKSPIYSNITGIFEERAPLPNITQCVFFQHGEERDGDITLNNGVSLLQETKLLNTLIFAPQFFSDSDRSQYDSSLNELLVWPMGGGWMSGEVSDGRYNLPRISSFQVIDDILVWLLKSKNTIFPNLLTVIIAGHSAGGQFVHHYTALNSIHPTLLTGGIVLRYVIANPSSYLYFTNERPNRAGNAPEDVSFQPLPANYESYNDYKYGTENIDSLNYVTDHGIVVDKLFSTVVSRNVSFFFGSRDNDPAFKLLDKTPPAEAQGATHLQRGENFVLYERYLASKDSNLQRTLKANREAFIVEDVGHDDLRMFGSKAAMKAIFGVSDTQGAESTSF